MIIEQQQKDNSNNFWYETKLFCCKPWEIIFSHHPGYVYTLSANYGLLPPFLLPWNVCFTAVLSHGFTAVERLFHTCCFAFVNTPLPLLLLYRVPVTFTYFIHSCLLWCFHFVTSHLFSFSFYHPFSFYPSLSFSLTHDLFVAEYHHFVSSIQTCNQQHKQSKFFLANNFPLWNR